MDKPLSVFPKGAGSMTAEKTSGRQMSDTFRAAAARLVLTVLDKYLAAGQLDCLELMHTLVRGG